MNTLRMYLNPPFIRLNTFGMISNPSVMLSCSLIFLYLLDFEMLVVNSKLSSENEKYS